MMFIFTLTTSIRNTFATHLVIEVALVCCSSESLNRKRLSRVCNKDWTLRKLKHGEHRILMRGLSLSPLRKTPLKMLAKDISTIVHNFPDLKKAATGFLCMQKRGALARPTPTSPSMRISSYNIYGISTKIKFGWS